MLHGNVLIYSLLLKAIFVPLLSTKFFWRANEDGCAAFTGIPYGIFWKYKQGFLSFLIFLLKGCLREINWVYMWNLLEI